PPTETIIAVVSSDCTQVRIACSRAEEYPTVSGRSIRSQAAPGKTEAGAAVRDNQSAKAATTSRIITPSRLQEFQQLTMKDLGRLEMRDVTKVRQQHELSARNRVGDMLCQLGEIRAVFFAADLECFHLDVRPVVHDRILIDHLLYESPHHRRLRPIAAEGHAVLAHDHF